MATPHHLGYLRQIAEAVTCTQPGAVTSFTADTINLDGPPGWDVLSVFKPECCAVTITTNLGAFTIPKGVCAFSLDRFQCGLVTELTVAVTSGDCEPNNIHINLQYTGGPCPS